jgi:hypothetical protein
MDVFISPKEDLYAVSIYLLFYSILISDRYIVTDLMWTNLQKLIAKGPIENEFSRYFLYQILVRCKLPFTRDMHTNNF